MNPLKRLHPQLSTLAAQVIYAKHKEQAEREVAELRQTLAQLIREGRSTDELVQALISADPDKLSLSGKSLNGNA
jgi:hypothetical protein